MLVKNHNKLKNNTINYINKNNRSTHDTQNKM